MTCRLCGDKGVLRIRYHDATPDDYGVCLCPRGLRLRASLDTLAAALGVPAAQLGVVEALLEADEIPADLLAPAVGHADIADAGRAAGGKKARL